MQRASEVRDERSGERKECHSFFFFWRDNELRAFKDKETTSPRDNEF